MQQGFTAEDRSGAHRDIADPVFGMSGEALEAHWRGMCVSTAPADRAIAEEGVRIAYREAGLPSPRIVWHDGPVSLAGSWAATSLGAGENARDAVVAAPCRRVARRISTHADGYVRLLRDWLGHDRSCAASAAMCAATIEAATSPSLRKWGHGLRALFANRRWPSSFADSGLSQHELCWLGFNASLLQMLERYEIAELHGLELVCANVGWMLPHARVCWLADRPVELSFDRWGRLHSSSRPAVRYLDGWSMYAWKGTRVPAWVIDAPQDITLDWIDAEIDPLVRRAMIDIITPARFVDAGGATCVTRDAAGALWARKWSYRGAVIDSWAAVELPACGELRSFRCVPGHLRTLAEALTWLHRPSR
jgi:hypothetical protein